MGKEPSRSLLRIAFCRVSGHAGTKGGAKRSSALLALIERCRRRSVRPYRPRDLMALAFHSQPLALKPVAQSPRRIAVVGVILSDRVSEGRVRLGNFAKLKRVLHLPQSGARIFERDLSMESVKRFQCFEGILFDAGADSPPGYRVQVHQ